MTTVEAVLAPPTVAPPEHGVRVRELDVDPALADGIAERFDREPTIVLVADASPEAARALVAAGARGVLARDTRPDDLDAAIAAVARGFIVLDARAMPAGGDPTVLTPRERDVLALMADGGSNKTIARRLGVADNTVKFHVASILSKLGASTRTEAVTIGVRRGWILI